MLSISWNTGRLLYEYKQIARQPEEHFQQLPRFIPLPAYFCIRIVALVITIAQRECNAVCIINRLPYNQSCWCQLDRICDQPMSTTTSVVDDTMCYSASTPSWTCTTVVDGYKFSVVRYLSFKQQKWPWWLAVTGNGSTYDFLLVFNCNYDSIVYHFRDIITFSQNLKRSHDLNTSFSEIIYHTFTSTP